MQQNIVYLSQILLIQFACLRLQSQSGHEKIVAGLGQISPYELLVGLRLRGAHVYTGAGA